jgi:hypothetical protein
MRVRTVPLTALIRRSSSPLSSTTMSFSVAPPWAPPLNVSVPRQSRPSV